MSLTVKNIGVMQSALGGATGTAGKWFSGGRNTNVANQFGEVGTVKVVYEGKEYVFGPNQSITFADDGIGTAVAAADSRLRVVDDRDGNPKIYYANPSGPITKW